MEKIRKHETKILVFVFLILGLVALSIDLSAKKPDIQEPSREKNPSVDTFIPRGFVLVPVDLANAESLSSLIGDVGGVVDLYQAQSGLHADEEQNATLSRPKKPRWKVASKVKIMKAPLNPQQYAVLIKDSESSTLLNQSGPFIAVVQNPNTQGSQVAQESKSSVHIDYQN